MHDFLQIKKDFSLLTRVRTTSLLRAFFVFAIIVSLSFPFQTVRAAQIPPQIFTYQGRLTDSGGNLLGGTGTAYYFKFSVWDNATVGSGNRVWPATAPASVSATVKQGVFTVNIGDTANGYPNALNLDFSANPNVYLQVEVSSDNVTFETLSPRQQLTSAAFAQVAGAVIGTTTPSVFGTTTPVANSFVTIAATSTNSIPLSLIGALNQVANLFQIKDSTGTNLFSVGAAGGVTMASATSTNFFATTASSTNLFTSNLSVGSLSGILKATAGAVTTALVNLASDVTGILPVGNGGTGVASIAANTVLLGNGTGAISTTTAGTNGQILALVNGVPTFVATTTFSTPLSFINGAVSFDFSHPNTFTGLQQFNGNASTTVLTVSGTASTTDLVISALGGYSTTCVQADINGKLSVTGTACGSGGGAVNSVSNSDGTLTISPTTGIVVASLNLGHANSWSALQQFSQSSSTQLSALTAYFGATATSSFASNGALTLAQALGVSSGGTGSTTLSGILKGNGTSQVGTVVIGSGLSWDGSTLSSTGSTYSASYPVTLAGSVFGLAFGTTTSNTWAGTQTFTNAPTLASFTGLVGANSGVTYAVSTSSPLNTSITGNAGSVTNGVYTTDTGTVSNTMLAASAVTYAKIQNVNYGEIIGRNTSGAGVSTGLSTSTYKSMLALTASDVGLGSVTNAAQVTSVTGTWPIISSGGTTPNLTWGGLATSSPIAVASGLLYATGVNTFASVATSSAINMSITGNAGTATKLAATKNINGVAFDGSADITVASTTLLGDTNTWSLAQTFTTAPKFASFTGLVGANAGQSYAISTTSMNASITGNAGTATKLAATKNINNVAFDGSADITINAASSTLLANNNTFSGNNTFTNAPTLGSLSGLVGVNAGAPYSVSTSTLNIGGSAATASNVTGTVAVGNGGTGQTSFTSSQLIYGNGSSALTSVATSSLSLSGTTLSSTGTFGALVGGTATTLALNLGNANTWSALQQFNGNASTTALTVSGTASTTNLIVSSLGSASTQCVQVSSTGVLSGTGSACGTGSGAVNSVTNSDSTLTISPTTGSVVASLNLGHANSWSALQQFSQSSSTQLSALTAYFGATATSSFASNGALTLAQALTVSSGGTGSTTLSGILKGNGTSQVGTVVIGSGLSWDGSTLSSTGSTYSASYPVTLTGSVFGLAFGTTTSNTWAGTQAFTTATTTNLIVSSAGGSGTRCLQVAADGTVSATAGACGVAGAGIQNIGPANQLASNSTVTIGTTTSSFNGLTVAETVTGTASTLNWTPSLSGTLGIGGGGTGLGTLSGNQILYTNSAGTAFAQTSTSTLSIGGNAGTVTNGVYTTDTGTVSNTMLAGSIAGTKLSDAGVTLAKLANLAYGTIIGRTTNTTGVPEAIATSTYKSMLALTASDVGLGSVTNAAQVTSVTGTYPITSSLGTTPAISIAFGTTTSNTWAGTQTFSTASTSALVITGQAAPSGQYCLQIDASGNVTKAGGACGISGGGITQIGPVGQMQTGGTQTLATSTADTNLGMTIVGSGDTQTFTPYWIGTLGVNRGGTGVGSFTANSLLYSNSAGTALAFAATSTLNIGGNAGTATKLASPVTINGVSFDGSGNIVVASTTLLANNNTFSGTNTFSSTITGSVSGNAGSVTNGVYTTTFGTLFDNRLSATTSVSGITTLPNLSITKSQVSDFGTYENPLTFTYPLSRAINAISLAFGTTTSNLWAGTQTFTNAPTLASFTGLVGANGGVTYAVSTSSPLNTSITGNAATVTTNANLSGVVTSSGSNTTSWGNAANGVLANPAAGSAAPSFVATSTLGIALSDTTGILSVLKGGTGVSSYTANSLLYANSAGTALAYAATSTLNIGGNAGTATKLASPVTINGVSFDGSGNIVVASTTLLANNNTFSGTNTFSTLPTLGSLAGLVGANAGTLYQISTTSMNASITGTAGNITGIAAVANGGTGWANIQANAIPYGNGTTRFSTTTQGTGGQILAWSGGIPTWVATTSIPLAGDVGGTLSSTAIQSAVVTYAKLQNLNYGEIIGRNTAAAGVSTGLATSTYKSMLALTASDVGLGSVTNNAQVTAVTGTWPIISSGTLTPVISFGGLSTSSPLAAGAAILYATGVNTMASVATSSVTFNNGIAASSGSLGYQIGGSNVTIGIATNALALTQLPQIAANSILGNGTGALGNVTALATSTLNIGGTAGNVTGTVAIANGGTASTTALGGILVGNGSSAIKSLIVGSGLSFDGATLSASGSGITSMGAANQLQSGGTQTLATSTADTNLGMTIVSGTNTHTFTPYWIGTLGVNRGGTGVGSFTANSLLYSNSAGTALAYAATSTLNIGGTAGNITGIAAVANGGTGWAAVQANAIPYGNGTTRFSTTTQGTGGQILAWSGGIPAWISTTTIPVGGSVSGTLSNITVVTNANLSGVVTSSGNTTSWGNAANGVLANPAAGSAAPSFIATSTMFGPGTGGQVLGWSNATGGIAWVATSTSGGGVTAISIASANGFAGSSSGGSTPALTISTSVSGLLKGNGTAISAASNGTDYTLITANTCGAGNHVSAITAAGVITCSADTGGSGGAFAWTPLTNYGVNTSATTTALWAEAGLFASSSSAYPTLAVKQSGAGSVADFSNSTKSVLSIASGGFGTTTVAGLNISAQATTTSNVGMNISSGCYAINNVCVGGGGSASTGGLGVEDIQVFSANATWTKASYVNNVYVQVWGSGAGGLTAASNSSMGGGGSGGYSAGVVAVSGNVSVVVGTGGTQNNNGTASNFAGGTTVAANGGTRPTTNTGGAGATAGTGTIALAGQAGGNGLAADGAGSGNGGSAPLGGAGGTGIPGGNASGGTAKNGKPGTIPGGGGAGGAESNGTGASGANGMVIVWGMGGVSGSDLAEMYETKADVKAGDVVAMSTSTMTYNSEWGLQDTSIMEKATPGSHIVGVVSTAPQIVMGKTISQTAKNPQPIALAGRTPVKVSLENGPIKIGDILGPSSIPGVAAKMAKAGVGIGAALEDYKPPPDGSIGTVMMFVETKYSTGARTKDILANDGIDTDTIAPGVDLGRIILASQMIHKQDITASTTLSEINTDRVTAGLEVISPRVLTDTLVVDSIEPVDKNIRMKLAEGGKLIIEQTARDGLSVTFGTATSTPGALAVSIDDLGNAFFAGALTGASLEIGSSDNPSGITLYDKATGLPYCTGILNGALTTVPGKCAAIGKTATTTPSAQAPPPASAPSPPAPPPTVEPASASTTQTEASSTAPDAVSSAAPPPDATTTPEIPSDSSPPSSSPPDTTAPPDASASTTSVSSDSTPPADTSAPAPADTTAPPPADTSAPSPADTAPAPAPTVDSTAPSGGV